MAQYPNTPKKSGPEKCVRYPSREETKTSRFLEAAEPVSS